MSGLKKAAGYTAVVLMIAFSSAGWAYKRYPRGNVWTPSELTETKPLPSGSDSEFVAVRIGLPENKNDADPVVQSDALSSEKISTASRYPVSSENPADNLPEKKTPKPMAASDLIDHEPSANPVIKGEVTLDKNGPSAPQTNPTATDSPVFKQGIYHKKPAQEAMPAAEYSGKTNPAVTHEAATTNRPQAALKSEQSRLSGAPPAQAKGRFIGQKDRAAPADAEDNAAETSSKAVETSSSAPEVPTKMPEETNQHADSAQKQRMPSIEAGFWQIDRKSTVITQGQAQSTAFQQDFVCYSEALIKQESEKGFMANWGVDALPGFSCKETQAPYQEGMQIVRQLTCQSEKGQQSLIVRYNLWLGGTWLNGLLEAGLQEGLFRLEIMGRRVGECPVEIRH